MITYTVTRTETQTVYDIKNAHICLGKCRSVVKEGHCIWMLPKKKDDEFCSLLVSLFMGLHPRLGKESPLQMLEDDVLGRISSILLSSLSVQKKRWDLMPRDGGSYTFFYPFEGEAYGYPGPKNVFKGMRVCYHCNHMMQEEQDEKWYEEDGTDRAMLEDMAADCIRLVKKLEKNAILLNPEVPARSASRP